MRFKSLLGIETENSKQTLLMFLYLFLLISGTVMAKAVRDALFLTRIGGENLPYLYIAIALLTGAAAYIYTQVFRGTTQKQATSYSLVLVAFSVAGFWWLLLHARSVWILPVFYIWVTIYDAILVSQFWLLANRQYHARQARRTFAFLGAGGIVGGIVGGFTVNLLAPRMGAESLLLIVSFMLLVCIFVARKASGKEAVPRPAARMEEGSGSPVMQGLRMLQGSRYLIWIALVLSVTELVSTLVDFQFKVIAQNTFATKDDLASFFGIFQGSLSIANFFLQIFLTGRIIDSAGVKSAILILPFAILGGSVAFLFTPALWSGILLKLGDDGFRHSIHRSVVEMLYLPVPDTVKSKIKIFIDSVAVRFAAGLGGILILLYTQIFGMRIGPLSLIVILFTIAWILLSFLAYSEYVNAFREGLKKRAIDPGAEGLQIKDMSTLETLVQALNSWDERLVLYAMDFLQRTGKTSLISPWLLHHPSPKVRFKIVNVISDRADPAAVPILKSALGDESVDVQAQAVQTICALDPESYNQMVFSLSSEKDPKLRRAAILCASHGDEEMQKRARQWTLELAQTPGPAGSELRIEAARALGMLPAEYSDLYSILKEDPDIEVVRETIRSAAVSRNPDLIPWLLQKLGDTKLKSDARAALVLYGPEMIPVLESFLTDDSLDLWSRRHIPRTIGAIGTQAAVDTLLKHHHHPDRFIRNKVLNALSLLRFSNPDFHFDRGIVEGWLNEEVQDYFRYLTLSEAIDGRAATPSFDVLSSSLQRRLSSSIDRIFRLLALIYPQRDILNSYVSLTKGAVSQKVSAIEFLDGLLDRSTRRLILPAIDLVSPAEKLRKVQAVIPLKRPDHREAIVDLLNKEDDWLSACAVYYIYAHHESDLYPVLKQCVDRTNTLAGETAQIVVGRLNLG